MRTRTGKLAALLGLAVAWAAAAEARPLRQGKVVRIERPRLVSKQRLQLCPISGPTGGQAGGGNYCLGPKPDSGAEGVWFNAQTEEVIGRIRFDNPQPHPQDTCGLGQLHLLDVELIQSGPAPAPGGGYSAGLAILGLEASPDARLRYGSASSPSGNPDEYVIVQVDRDGDGEDDMVITDRTCDAEHPPPASVARRVFSTRCYGFWVLDGPEWRRVQEDVFHQCQ